MSSTSTEFRFGWFSIGDIVSIATGFILVGMMWTKVETHEKQLIELRAVQQSQSEAYVRKDDYREDIREIKQSLREINTKLDSKADRP